MRLHFYLKDKKSIFPTPIYLAVSYEGQRFRYSIGQKIHPSFWIPETERVETFDDLPAYVYLNEHLDTIESFVRAIQRNCKNENISLSNPLLKQELDKRFKKQKKQKVTFLEFIEQFIQQSKTRKKLPTIKVYKNTLTHLKDFQTHQNIELRFEHINMNFYNTFVDYLKQHKKLTHNTIGKHIKDLRVFLGAAHEQKISNNTIFLNKNFKILKESKIHVYLTQTELSQLFEFDASAYPKLEIVRDLFLLSALTGLHFKTLYQFTTKELQQETLQFINKHQQVITLPIHWMVATILQKYNYQLPDFPNVQTFNKQIKEVVKLAGIHQLIQYTTIESGKRLNKAIPKNQLITTHIARLSFFTNAYLEGITPFILRQISGHASDKAFLQYIHQSNHAASTQLKKHSFFKKFVT